MPTLVSSVPEDALAPAAAAGWSVDPALEEALEEALRAGRRRLVVLVVAGELSAAEVEAHFAALRALEG